MNVKLGRKAYLSLERLIFTLFILKPEIEIRKLDNILDQFSADIKKRECFIFTLKLSKIKKCLFLEKSK